MTADALVIALLEEPADRLTDGLGGSGKCPLAFKPEELTGPG